MDLCDTKKDLEIVDYPQVPRPLASRLARITRGARRILVKEPSTTTGSWKQINSLTLDTSSPQHRPTDPPKSIALTVAAIMHQRWSELNEGEGEPVGAIRFQVMAERMAGTINEKQPSFEFKWDGHKYGDADAEDSDASESDDADALQRNVLLEIIDRQQQDIDMYQGHISELHGVIVSIGQTGAEPARIAGEQTRFAGDLMMKGFGILQNGLMNMYSMEAARAHAESETQRKKETWDRLDKYFSFASSAIGQQVGNFIKRKMGGGNAATEEEERRARKAARQTQGPNDDASDDSDAEGEEEDEETIEHPIAVLCEVFGSSLTPKQRKSMREALDAPTFELFDELFCSETDDEAIELFQLIKSRANPMQLLELASMLDKNQMNYYQRVTELVELAGVRDGDDGDSDGDDGDDE